LETSFDNVIVPEVVSNWADTTTTPCPDFTVTKSIGAAAENEIVVPRFPSTLGPATGDVHETLGLSTVRTLSGSPWLARANPVTLNPVRTTTATTSRRARFRFPKRTCLAIDPYLLLCAATAGSRATYRTSETNPYSPPRARRETGLPMHLWPSRANTQGRDARRRTARHARPGASGVDR
jgi:hypothetical protein